MACNIIVRLFDNLGHLPIGAYAVGRDFAIRPILTR